MAARPALRIALNDWLWALDAASDERLRIDEATGSVYTSVSLTFNGSPYDSGPNCDLATRDWDGASFLALRFASYPHSRIYPVDRNTGALSTTTASTAGSWPAARSLRERASRDARPTPGLLCSAACRVSTCCATASPSRCSA